ncbi:MAG: DUF2812 domain-containing protein [Oscillibacter ruminantium]|uniref:DUF2812 domain-containing protein n=1 Tax=Oscillibacter ruminantium TaxID=1263547 RepID=UPI002B1F8147|nr:DUF2812 domain-containing protein [Oscillibacter ruminantium]MEA5042882.1 DUF2812 domain-containing protein [Oscillibacter ruminantium]
MFDRVEHRAADGSNTVRRWIRDDISDLDRNESWFSDMAEQGLFIDHFGACFAYFRKGTPRKTRYRIDVLSRKLTEDELALYDSCGWHFVVMEIENHWTPVYFYVYQTDENATIPELHTDPMEQAESLRRLHRGGMWDLCLSVALLLFWSWSSLQRHLYAQHQFDFLINGDATYVYWTLFSCFAVVEGLRRWRNVRRLYKRLAGGTPLDHHADYRAAHRFYALTAYLKPLLWALAMVTLLAQLAFSALDGTRPLPEGTPDFPAVRLAEIHKGLDSPDAVEGESNHELTWAGTVENRLWERGNDPETRMQITLSTTCYRLLFEGKADRAFDALLKEKWYRGISDEYWTAAATQVDTDLVDEAWAVAPGAQDDWQYALYVRDGRYIVTFFYTNHNVGRTEEERAAFRDGCTDKILPILAARLDEA